MRLEIKKVKTLRTLETHARYERHRKSSDFPKCFLCEASPLKKFKYWKVVENQFPYDEVATMSHMVVSLRHAPEEELTPAEIREYKKVKNECHENYDIIIENTRKQKSIPSHHHLHLLQIKERENICEEKRPPAAFLTPRYSEVEAPP